MTNETKQHRIEVTLYSCPLKLKSRAVSVICDQGHGFKDFFGLCLLLTQVMVLFCPELHSS